MANILASDINGWYSKLNNILVSHKLDPIAAPSITAGQTRTIASQLNAIKEKLAWAKTDKYYSYAEYTDIPNVISGDIMKEEVKTSIEATVNSIEAVVKCRNEVTNSYGGYNNGNSYCYNASNSTSGCSTKTTETQTTSNATYSQTVHSNCKTNSECGYAGGASDQKCTNKSYNAKYSQSGNGKATTTGNNNTTGDGRKTGNGKTVCGDTGSCSYKAPTTTTTIDISNANTVTHSNKDCSKTV